MNLQNIPQELRDLNQWVCTRGDSKIPIDPFYGYNASSTKRETWSSFETAERKVHEGKYDYVGFVFADNGYVGVDIDDGYDEDGFVSPLAADIISKCRSYTEKSKSGRGFHILLRGDLPFKGKNNRNGVEIYKTARYFIMTGDTLLYDAIVENQEAIDYIVDKYFSEMRESENKAFNPKIYTPIWEKPMTDGRIKLRPVYPLIPDGCRNICLTSLAGMLHNQGYNPQVIYDELTYCNTVACEPMLPDGEVVTIVNSVTRYKR
jgi:hypothetical protein